MIADLLVHRSAVLPGGGAPITPVAAGVIHEGDVVGQCPDRPDRKAVVPRERDVTALDQHIPVRAVDVDPVCVRAATPVVSDR